VNPPLLFLAYYYPPQNASGAQRPYRLVKYLSQAGHSCRVICSAPELMGPLSGSDAVQAVSGRDTGLGGTALRGFQKLLGRQGDRLKWVAPAVEAASHALQENPRTVVFSSYPPVCTHVAGLILKRRFGNRWIADFRDPMTGNAFRPGWINRTLDRTLEQAIMRNADLIVVNTGPAEERLARYYPQSRDRIVTVWNGFDPDEPFGPEPIPPAPHRVLAHIGDLYGPRHPGILLASLRRLVDSGRLDAASLRMRLIGPLDEKSPLRENPLFHQLREKQMVECNEQLIPKAEAMHAIATADMLLLLDLTGRENNIQVPAKLFDYIRVGRPILAVTTPDSPTERILACSGVRHTTVHVTDPEPEVDRKVSGFLALPADPRSPSEWFRQQFDARAQAANLAGMLQKLA
jgi:hypothetical protein